MDKAANTISPDVSGHKWVHTLWGLEARWTVEPDTIVVMETVKSTLNIRTACSIEFLAKGAFNKLYVVKYAENEVVARITLPVDPKWKTLSEVATLKWVHQNTSLPVSEVLGFNADRTNPVGFGWIIMTKVPGRPWADAWQGISFAAKEQLSEIEERATETNKFFAATGSPSQERPDTGDHLNQDPGVMDAATPSIPGFTVQRMVSSAFIGNDVDPKIFRGPFATSREWLSARLDLTELDCSRRLSRVLESDPVDVRETTDDSNTTMIETGTLGEGEDNEKDYETDDSTDGEDEDDDPEDLENTLKIIARLRTQLPNFSPFRGPEKEPPAIFHDDMNRHNIVVDEEGALTAVVD
ncbi:kinase-like protein [Colletotrichum incanum]|uniref:Kinase-like protein n=1 Tax=Colletotrichum incanum TaxID=1573173 RepID=A0A161Y893_COLIC|nr:kinase-like protein [Colletotrichum incanum]